MTSLEILPFLESQPNQGRINHKLLSSCICSGPLAGIPTMPLEGNIN